MSGCKGGVFLFIITFEGNLNGNNNSHHNKMNTIISLDMLQSAGVGALALVTGMIMTKKIRLLQRFCIPSPVSGGLLFSVLTLLVYSLFNVELEFDATLQNVFMLAFYTSVGFQSDPKVLKKGGRPLFVMVILLILLMSLQNLLPVSIAKAFGVDPLIGMVAGSISMAGGHGTAGGFSPLLQSMGFESALTASMACATFGLIAGSMLGGPLASQLIRKRLKERANQSAPEINPAMAGIESDEASPAGRAERLSSSEIEFQRYARATYAILIVMALGVVMSNLLQKTGITFPTYFGALLTAACVRVIIDATPGRKYLEMEKIVSVGNISLSVFLGMAMISLKLWELESLAMPLVVMLFSQVILMALFVWFIAFPLLGKDYDSAVLCAGMCGFGLGATPNAMANMSAVCYKYYYTVKPFLIVPIVGAMFVDMLNTGIITAFLNWLQ